MFDFQQGIEHRMSYLTHGVDLNKAEQFADFLQNYTNAAISLISVTQGKVLTGVTSSGPIQNLGLYAEIFMRSSVDSKLYCLHVHAPKEMLFDPPSSKKETRVNQTKAEEIVSEYSILAGIDFVYNDGWLVGHAI